MKLKIWNNNSRLSIQLVDDLGNLIEGTSFTNLRLRDQVEIELPVSRYVQQDHSRSA